MTIQELATRYFKHPNFVKLNQLLADKNNRNFSLTGLCGSSVAFAVASVFEKIPDSVIYLANDEESAGYIYNDLIKIFGNEKVGFFPSSFKKSFATGKTDSANEILRTETLNRLSDKKQTLVITYPEAVAEKVIPSKTFQESVLKISVGEKLDTEFIEEVLQKSGFQRVDFVYEPGQYSCRGSIIDIFSFSSEMPFRIDFFGDEVESIRVFNIETQLSEEQKNEVHIVPDMRFVQKKTATKSVSFMQFFSEDALLIFASIPFVAETIQNIYESSLSSTGKKPEALDEFLLRQENFNTEIHKFRKIEIANKKTLENSLEFEFQTSPQTLFHKNFDLVASSFKQYIADGFQIFILSDSLKQTDRIQAIFEDKEEDIAFTPIKNTVHEGFVDSDCMLCIFSDHQIFDRFHKYNLKSDRARNGKVLLTLKELNQFKLGDYITHIDHGVGQFGGLFKTEINGKKQEVIKLIYKDNDVLFVSIHNLHRISKYRGKDGLPPKINKLGSGAWEKLKEKTKRKVKDIARDLIALYARRKAEKGFAYSPDTYLQHELEASFIYEDTPDQQKATADVKHDMERALPMDRLVCGDVGFGKTEVAMRAAFKAVTDGKQVAVLVPTTVLALQHYNSFRERMKNFPCEIDYLSRAKKTSDAKATLKKLSEGKIDIIIGTHRLVGKDVKFKDLGLLIIDEEQKFGVSVKEKLKALKVNVDTLTMTATPIPRTLQFSLLGARDLSIINTPPPNRYPIQTELSEFNPEVLREAIERELNRNGQVFIINNRIQNIYDLEATVKKIVPQARTVVGHGQMDADKLENIILDFMDYEYDVLIATTIIESGIDIPNANTIIVNNAQNFGLSDLHQLRGRVGRSNRKAYCYLLTPPLSSVTDDARRRLQAIETFSDLGSGFQIAMQDLDIRGAGNMLGAEQSGFIADLGYETYQKILNEAVTELKNEEFADLYADEIEKENSSSQYLTDCTIESDLELLIPTDYVENISERMSLYRELDNLTTDAQLQDYQKRMEDRFGKIPQPVDDLFLALRMRWLAMKLGFEKIVLKNGAMIGYFVSNLNSNYYQSETFNAVLVYATTTPERCLLKEKNNRRSLAFRNVATINEAYDIFLKINALSK